MKTKQTKPILFALSAAALYAVNTPVSKLLLDKIPAAMMAALLYLGAGSGLFIIGLIQKKSGKAEKELPLTKKELPYTVGMVLLDIAAPIFMMIGLSITTAANASLLGNFEIVATSVIALFVFKESISKRLWLSILLVTLSSIILSGGDINSFSFSFGSVYIFAACICWGFENNCTRKLSAKNPLQIVVIKGIFSGIGSLVIVFLSGETITDFVYIPAALFLGFISYGLSIFFYILAQRELGAAKTSTYYAVAPFIGTALSLIIFKEIPNASFVLALIIMFTGAYLASIDNSHKSN